MKIKKRKKYFFIVSSSLLLSFSLEPLFSPDIHHLAHNIDRKNLRDRFYKEINLENKKKITFS